MGIFEKGKELLLKIKRGIYQMGKKHLLERKGVHLSKERGHLSVVKRAPHQRCKGDLLK